MADLMNAATQGGSISALFGGLFAAATGTDGAAVAGLLLAGAGVITALGGLIGPINRHYELRQQEQKAKWEHENLAGELATAKEMIRTQTLELQNLRVRLFESGKLDDDPRCCPKPVPPN